MLRAAAPALLPPHANDFAIASRALMLIYASYDLPDFATGLFLAS